MLSFVSWRWSLNIITRWTEGRAELKIVRSDGVVNKEPSQDVVFCWVFLTQNALLIQAPCLLFSSRSMAMTGQSSFSSMSNHTKERVTMAKVTLENFYSNLIAQHEEREMR